MTTFDGRHLVVTTFTPESPNPRSKTVVHAFGPFDTKTKARYYADREKKRFVRDQRLGYHPAGKLMMYVRPLRDPDTGREVEL